MASDILRKHGSDMGFKERQFMSIGRYWNRNQGRRQHAIRSVFDSGAVTALLVTSSQSDVLRHEDYSKIKIQKAVSRLCDVLMLRMFPNGGTTRVVCELQPSLRDYLIIEVYIFRSGCSSEPRPNGSE